MNELVVSIMIWISAEIGLPIPESPPAVFFMEKAQIRLIAGDNTSIGIYHLDTDMILLSDNLNLDNVEAQSILAHEIVHYMQDMANVQLPCNEAYEYDAYGIQLLYLENHGVDTSVYTGLSPEALRPLTTCKTY